MTVRSGLRRRTLLIVLAVVVASQLILAAVGTVLFGHAPSDALRPVDAIVVLGGEHDGREAYGVELARRGLAPVVLLSDPYPSDDALMRQMCDASTGSVTVICRAPDPSTTRGEAMMARQLASEYGWTSVMVVSWRYHLPRARYLFKQCFSEGSDAVQMQAVPRTYDYSIVHWHFTFLYQSVAFAKAAIQGSCG